QGWSDGGAATHVVHFTGAVSLVANFSAEYYLNVSSLVSGAGGSGWYPAGATVTATVSNQYYAQGPGERLAFQGWSGNATGTHLTSDPILMDGPKTAVAQYGTQFYLDVSSAYGTVLGADWYGQGTTAHAIVASSGDAGGTDPAGARPTPMNGPRTVGTAWRTEYELRITSAYGSLVGAGWYQAGSPATASVNASVIGSAAGERVVFAGWTGD